MISLKPRPFVQSSFDVCRRPDSHTFSFCLLTDVAFPSIFRTIAVFLYGEYVVRFFLPNGVFLPCDHGLDFLYKLV